MMCLTAPVQGCALKVDSTVSSLTGIAETMLSVPQVPYTTASCGFSATPDGMYICAVRPISTHATKTKHVHMAGWYISDIYMFVQSSHALQGNSRGSVFVHDSADGSRMTTLTFDKV